MYYPPSQNSLKVQLAEDAKRIKDTTLMPPYMTCRSSLAGREPRGYPGELKTWIGDSKPYSEIKSYISFSSVVSMVSAGWRVLEK
ncbi:hypothetical protein MJ699_00505 [Klebsiella pneumoniae]|nr:hypothetical protein MJ699_00505 [Klebsiella pneumoniae]